MTDHCFENELIYFCKEVHYSGKDVFKLTDDLVAHWNGNRITVKAGYKSDGASIPRVAWRVIGNPFEEYLAAAVIHDILYDTEIWDRKKADECFLDLMECLGVGKIRRKLMYRAVRMFAAGTWKKHTSISIKHALKYLSIGDI